jgi:uncharacterized membrane protein
MILNIPLAIWFGFATGAFFILTVTFGILFFYFKKPLFPYHKYFAFITIALAVIHIILAVLLWFFGITI